MNLSHILKTSTLTASLIFAAPFAFASSNANVVADPASIQKAITELQGQIQQLASNVPKKMAVRNAANQKAMVKLEKQTQAQFAHLQSEIDQLQSQMLKQIAQVQKEVQQEAQIK